MRRRTAVRKLRGFTLIELLVVISIIGLLMAILLPAMQRVRKQAMAVVCRSNLHQLSFVLSAYTDDNDGRFWRGWEGVAKTELRWFQVLEPVYKNPKLRFCPMAVKPLWDSANPQGTARNPFGAWAGTTMWGGDQTGGRSGSYGVNAWILNPRQDLTVIGGTFPAEDKWRTPNVQGAGNIPAFSDAWWADGHPFHTNVPPDFDGQMDGARNQEMNRFFLNRHNKGLNMLFLDWSVRKVGLKELWVLKWHRTFDTAGAWTQAGGVLPEDWPQWMTSFKDY